MAFDDTSRLKSAWVVHLGASNKICNEIKLLACMEVRNTLMNVSIGDDSTQSCSYDVKANIVFRTSFG